jgi:hypothetical protein
MSKVGYNLEVLPLEDVTDDLVTQCASLFNNHYAIWGKSAETASGGKLVEGKFDVPTLCCCLLWD